MQSIFLDTDDVKTWGSRQRQKSYTVPPDLGPVKEIAATNDASIVLRENDRAKSWIGETARWDTTFDFPNIAKIGPGYLITSEGDLLIPGGPDLGPVASNVKAAFADGSGGLIYVTQDGVFGGKDPFGTKFIQGFMALTNVVDVSLGFSHALAF